jgi:putative toxin-antitoxin system antitoxin component (TIGR02293 family)
MVLISNDMNNEKNLGIMTPYKPSKHHAPPLEATILGLDVRSKQEMMTCIETGFPKSSLTRVLNFLDLPTPSRIEGHLQVSTRTLQRVEKTLTPMISNNLYVLSTLLARAKELFEDDDKARAFLLRSNPALGGVAPLDYAKTAIGAQAVLDLIGGLEHGIIQ